MYSYNWCQYVHKTYINEKMCLSVFIELFIYVGVSYYFNYIYVALTDILTIPWRKTSRKIFVSSVTELHQYFEGDGTEMCIYQTYIFNLDKDLFKFQMEIRMLNS